VSHRSIVLFLRGAIAACMFFAVPAFGATYCVSPSGGTTLWQRLRDWQADSANQATVLKLEQGTYPISIAVDYRTGSTGDLDIEGGYTPGFGCSDSHRSKDASTTVLDGGISGTFAIAFETNVRLAVLKLQNYQATTGYDGVFIGAINSPGDVSVDHVISYANSIFSIRGGSSATVKDMLVYGQPALPGWDAISIGTEEGVATATNLTVADNHAGGLRLGDASDTVNPASLYDSIACNNVGGDVYPDPPGPAPQARGGQSGRATSWSSSCSPSLPIRSGIDADFGCGRKARLCARSSKFLPFVRTGRGTPPTPATDLVLKSHSGGYTTWPCLSPPVPASAPTSTRSTAIQGGARSCTRWDLRSRGYVAPCPCAVGAGL